MNVYIGWLQQKRWEKTNKLPVEKVNYWQFLFYSNPYRKENQALSSVLSSYIVCILAAKARAYFLIRVATSPPFG